MDFVSNTPIIEVQAAKGRPFTVSTFIFIWGFLFFILPPSPLVAYTLSPYKVCYLNFVLSDESRLLLKIANLDHESTS